MKNVIFKVVLADVEESMLGYEWIEVLGFIPFAVKSHTFACCDPDCKSEIPAWLYSNWVIVRTEHGIHRIYDEDFWEEVGKGIYVEEGTPQEEIEKAREMRRRRNEYLERKHCGEDD